MTRKRFQSVVNFVTEGAQGQAAVVAVRRAGRGSGRGAKFAWWEGASSFFDSNGFHELFRFFGAL